MIIGMEKSRKNPWKL